LKIKDRIKELRRVKASELMPNPKNWRTHPKEQQDALKGILAEVGYVDALLARELEDGTLQLIDGHLRAETTPDEEVPVLVIDVSEEESDKILATFDPLSAMASTDQELLDELLSGIESEDDGLQSLLESLASPEDTSRDSDVKEIPIDRPVEMAWYLIGIPIGRVGRHAQNLESIASDNDVYFDQCVGDRRDKENG